MSVNIRSSWSVFALSVLVLGPSAPVDAATVTINPSQDNSLIESDEGASCAIGNLYAGETRFAASRRALLAFDVAAAIPSGSTINSAELRLTLLRVGPFSAPTDMFTLHRVTASWGESTGAEASQCFGGTGAPAATDDATWSHRFWPDTPWATAGGDFNPTATAAIAMPTGGQAVWPTQANMVANVQSWLDDPANNFGWIILGDESLPTTAREFSSREAVPAELVVNYTAAPATTPPEVPDGRFAPPLLVNKLSADGADLQLSWDTAHCTVNPDHNVVYGTRSTFPASPGGTYGLQGVECGPSGSSPFSWLGSPNPAVLDPSSKLLWMLVIANDGATVEGSWGKNTFQERTGPGTNGSSNACGIADKSLANLCGQDF